MEGHFLGSLSLCGHSVLPSHLLFKLPVYSRRVTVTERPLQARLQPRPHGVPREPLWTAYHLWSIPPPYHQHHTAGVMGGTKWPHTWDAKVWQDARHRARFSMVESSSVVSRVHLSVLGAQLHRHQNTHTHTHICHQNTSLKLSLPVVLLSSLPLLASERYH